MVKYYRMWKRTKITHSQKDSFDLYCEQNGDMITSAFCCLFKGQPKILVLDDLRASLDEVYYDQNEQNIQWENVSDEFLNWPCESDYRAGQKFEPNGFNTLVAHLSFSIMNTRNLRFFGRHCKKYLAGIWHSEDGELHIQQNGTFSLKGGLEQVKELRSFPVEGKLSNEAGFIYIENPTHFVRFLVADVSDEKLVFVGKGENLFYTLTRASPMV